MQERIDNHEARIKKLEQRHTEEMKAINVNVGSKDVLDQLQEIEQLQNKISSDVDELKIDAKAYTSDAAIFKNKVERIESDVSTIKTDVDTLKTVQTGHSKYFEEHGKRLSATATKDNISTLETRLSKIEDTQEQILKLLQQKSNE